MKRTVEISSDAVHLTMRNDQLVVKRGGEVVEQIPCEDVGVVVVDHPQTSYTHGALSALSAAGASVVLCGRNHLPAAMLLPLTEHSEVVWRLDMQLAVGRPLRKQLWTQLVVAKIEAQAVNVHPTIAAHHKLKALAREVRSGDPTNVEAWAAKVYWASWLERPATFENAHTREFRRDYEGDGINALLNYGYAVVRAGLARAIVAAGLLPSLGLHHRRRGNAFCLADDLIEPLRPLVDRRVRELVWAGYESIDQTTKAGLLMLLSDSVSIDGERGPLMVQVHRFVSSLVDCYAGESRELRIPRQVFPEAATMPPDPARRTPNSRGE